MNKKFNLIREGVKLIRANGGEDLFEQLFRIGEGDVFFAISFPRYSLKTLNAIEFAASRGAKIITLTDSNRSPMTMYGSCNLYAKSDMASIMDSLVAPLSVINALTVSLCLKKQDSVMENLNNLENIWRDYESDELNKFKNEVDIYYE